MSGAVKTPGLRWDPKTQFARLEVCVPGTHGKVRRRKTVAAKNRKEATDEWTKFRNEVSARGGRGTVWTIRSYWTAFGPRINARLAEVTRRNLVFRVALVADRVSKPMHKVTPADARDLAAALVSEGYAPASVNAGLATLRLLLHDAADRGEIARYPLGRGLPFVKEEPLKLELSEEERARFLAAFGDETGYMRRIARLRVGQIGRTGYVRPDSDAAKVEFFFFREAKPLFVVALETGISRGDLISLTWAQIGSGWIRLRRRKTGIEATIPVSEECAAALEELRSRPVVGRLVFVSHSGRPVSWPTVRTHFAIAKELAGITRRFRFHDLRHTFASRLASAGVSLQVIARALGHSTIAMSQRYARPDETAMLGIKKALDGRNPNSGANSGRRENGSK